MGMMYQKVVIIMYQIINHACNPEAAYSGSYCLAYIVCNGWRFGDKYPW